MVACPACKKPIRLPRSSQEPDQKSVASSIPSNRDPAPPATQTKPCPFCAETILVAASKCKHCGEYLKKKEEASPAAGTASSFGVVAAIIGGLIAMGALMMDTTVSTATGDRVYNIGLQQQQMMVMLMGLAIFATGIFVAIFTWKKGYGNPPSKPIPETEKQNILYLAKNQKYLIWTLLAQILATVVLFAIPLIGVFLLLATLIAQVLFVFKIAITSFPGFVGVFLGFLSLIPFFGLIVIIIINGRATKLLKKAGVKVAFLGVPKEEILRFEFERT